MRIRVFFWLIAVLTLTGFGVSTTQGAAHLPIYDSGGNSMETALAIPDADVSYAIFAEFSSPTNRIHFYSFSVEAGHLLNFQVTVPAIDDLRNFAPVVLLIGPGIHEPDGQTSELLGEFGVDLPTGSGATAYFYDGMENTVEFEPFTQVNMWVRQDVEVTLPNQDIYYLAVAVPDGTTHDAISGFGKYVLAPGKLEAFGILDFVAIPIDWLRTHALWEHNILLFMLPTIVATIAISTGTWYYLLRRGKGPYADLGIPLKTAFLLAITGGGLTIGAAINQLLLVMSYTELSPEGADFIVIMLQSIGLVLGVAALRMAVGLVRPRSWRNVVVLLVVALAALIVGTGFIVGPVLFLAAGCVELFLANRESRMTPLK